MAHDPAALCVSAPGKVLLTGGYLILEERFAGLVVATTARFHSSISCKPILEPAVADGVLLAVRVESPQFDQVVRAHVVRHEGEADCRLVLRMSEDSDRNGYVEETLACALNGILGVDASSFLGVCDALRSKGDELHIRLEADNAFYSQVERLKQSGKPLSRRHLEELPAFLPPFQETVDGKRSSSIAKTGLGSSAALVTSLVGALVQFFMVGDLSDERRDLMHNLAQLSHCFVQRKIGSGFDVSSACYGSQRYARFSPSVLDKFTIPDNLIPEAIAQCVLDTKKWKRSERVMAFSLPSNLRLFMGDVSTGSATVSMVKKVLAWQKSSPVESEHVVSALASHNLAVEQSFRRLDSLARGVSEDGSERFAQKCSEMARVSAEQWKFVDPVIGEELYVLRSQYQSVRRFFREMGEFAGVPIEPAEQTALLDATMEIPGVLIAGVPGAGGYDAIFVLTLDAASLDRVENLWLDWPQTHPGAVICPLLCDMAPAASSALSIASI